MKLKAVFFLLAPILFGSSNNHSFSRSEVYHDINAKLSKEKTLFNDLLKIEHELPKVDQGELCRSQYYYKLANSYWNLNYKDKYLQNVRSGFRLAERLGDMGAVAKGCSKLGEYFGEPEVRKFDSAYFYLKKANQIYLNLESNYGFASNNLIKAQVLLHESQFAEAEFWTSEALKYFSTTGNDKSKIFHCFTNLGIIALQYGDNDKALYFFKKANNEIINSKTNDNWGKAIALNNLGTTYLALKKYYQAKNYFTAGLSVLGKSNPWIYSRLLENFAVATYKTTSDAGYSERLFRRALKVRDSLNFETTEVLVAYSKFCKNINRSVKASRVAMRAFENSGSEELEAQILAVKNLFELDASDKNRWYKELAQLDKLKILREDSRRKIIIKINRDFEFITREQNRQISKDQTLKILFLTAIIVLLSILLIWERENRRKQFSWAESQARLSEEVYKLIIEKQNIANVSRLDEKKKIAGNLHDSVASVLTGVRLNLHILNYKHDYETVQKCLKYINQIHLVEKQLRDISSILYNSETLIAPEFQEMIADLIRESNEFCDTDFVLNLDKSLPFDKISNDSKVHIFRIIQEGLNNIKKHSNAGCAFVDVFYEDMTFTFLIRDNGRGFDSKAKKNMGLTNMRYRADKIGGQLSIKSEINKGVQIKLTISHEQ